MEITEAKFEAWDRKWPGAKSAEWSRRKLFMQMVATDAITQECTALRLQMARQEAVRPSTPTAVLAGAGDERPANIDRYLKLIAEFGEILVEHKADQYWLDELHAYILQLEAAHAHQREVEVARLREALEFYASDENRKPQLVCEWDNDGLEHFITKKHVIPYEKDAGFRAKQALAAPSNAAREG